MVAGCLRTMKSCHFESKSPGHQSYIYSFKTGMVTYDFGKILLLDKKSMDDSSSGRAVALYPADPGSNPRSGAGNNMLELFFSCCLNPLSFLLVKSKG